MTSQTHTLIDKESAVISENVAAVVQLHHDWQLEMYGLGLLKNESYDRYLDGRVDEREAKR